MKVFLSELAENKLLKLNDFFKKFTSKVMQISEQPESCPKSLVFNGIYKCVVTKQTSFYYRINFNKNEIEIITVFDSRQNPNKLKKDLE